MTVSPQKAEDAKAAASPSGLGLGFVVIIAAQLMFILDTTVVNTALPKIQADLGFSSATALSWVLNAYALAFGGLLLLGGRAGDLIGRRKVFVAGVSVFTIGSLLGGLAMSPGWLLGARVVQGLGAAAGAPSTLAIVAANSSGTARTRAIAIYSAVSAAGASLGLILGGVITSWASWRWSLLINVPIGVAVVLLAPRLIRESERRQGRFDMFGAALSTAGMVCLVYAFIRVASNGWSDGLAMALFAAAVVLLAGFVLLESRVSQPIFPLRLLADRNRASAYLDIIFLSATMFGMFFFVMQFLQNVLEYTPIEAGLAFLPLTVTVVLMARSVPRLLKRFPAKPLMIAGTLLMTFAALWLTQLSVSSSYASIIFGPMLLFGLGMGLSFPPLNVSIMSTIAKSDTGAASGMLQTVQQIGGSLGLAVLVTVFGTAEQHAGHPSAAALAPHTVGQYVLTEGIVHVFYAATISMACGVLLVSFLVKARPRSAGAGPAAH